MEGKENENFLALLESLLALPHKPASVLFVVVAKGSN